MKCFNTQDPISKKPFDLLCTVFQHLQSCNFFLAMTPRIYIFLPCLNNNFSYKISLRRTFNTFGDQSPVFTGKTSIQRLFRLKVIPLYKSNNIHE